MKQRTREPRPHGCDFAGVPCRRVAEPSVTRYREGSTAGMSPSSRFVGASLLPQWVAQRRAPAQLRRHIAVIELEDADN